MNQSIVNFLAVMGVAVGIGIFVGGAVVLRFSVFESRERYGGYLSEDVVFTIVGGTMVVLSVVMVWTSLGMMGVL